MAETGGPGSDQRSRLSGPLPFVGRTQEVASLERLITAPDHGSAAALVTGEGGVGKSRLIEEVAARAAQRGWRVAHGRGTPVEAGTPYALFADAFLPILTELDEGSLTVLSRGGQAELAYLFPTLASAAGDTPADPASDPGEFRTRLIWNFTEFLKNYSARTPVLVVLEDLQWADASSLQLAHFLVRQAPGHPFFVLGTYRAREDERAPTLGHIERSLPAGYIGETLELAPLAGAAVTELIGRAFEAPDDVVRPFAERLHARTRGNPFFVEEVLKSLVASGRLRLVDDVWVGWDAGEFEVPPSVRDVVVAQVESFGEPARKALEVVAVAGTGTPYGVLLATTGLDEGTLLDALEELCRRRILAEEVNHGTVVYRFLLPVVQQTLYGELGLQRARILHGRVAEALEALSEESGGSLPVDELAYHFARTDPSRLGAKALRYLAAAGNAALLRHADHEAAEYFRAALSVTPPQGDADGVPTRAALVAPLARACARCGDFDGAVGHWTQLLDMLPPGTREASAVLRGLALSLFSAGRYADAFARLDEGLRADIEARDRVGEARMRLVRAHCLQAVGSGTAAREEADKALAVAEELGDPLLLARAHRSLALLHLWLGPPEKVLEHAPLAIELAGDAGDLTVAFWAQWALAVLSGMRGDTGAMAEYVEAASRIADQLRSPVLALCTNEISVEYAFARGDWDDGIRIGEQSIALARDLRKRGLLARLLALTSLFYLGRGAHDRARAMVDEARSVSDAPDGEADVHQVLPSHIALAHFLVGTGDYDGAIEAARHGLEIAEGTGYTLWAVHRLLPVLAEACLWAERIDEAAEVGARLRAHSEALDHRLGLAWADTCDALVQWKRGDPKAGARMMTAAAEALEQIPMVPYAARVRRQLAGRLAEIGDTEGALRELRAVHDTFSDLGADLELQAARGQFRELGQRPPPRRSGRGVAGLTERELEIARLVAARKSNKAVGKALAISPRTVSTHLSHIFHKLGVSSRGELTDLVREQFPPGS